MDQPPTPPSTSTQPAVYSPQQKGRSWWFWTKIGCGGVLALVLIFGLILLQGVNYLKNAAEPTMATLPPLQLSAGERQDVERIIIELDQAKRQKKVFDQSLSPRQFNGLFEWFHDEEKRKGKLQPQEDVFLRGEFEGQGLRLRFSAPAKGQDYPQPMYFNGEANFELEIVDGQFTKLEVNSFKLKGQDPPLGARWLVNMVAQAAVKSAKDPATKNDPQWRGLRAFKLFKREGDQIHIVIDGALLPPDE